MVWQNRASWSYYWPFVASGLLVTIAILARCLIRHRTRFVGLPMPPYSFLFGHIPILVKSAPEIPLDVHPHVLMTHIYRKFGLDAFFYLDNWPFTSYRQLIISDPAIAVQVAQTHSLPKHPVLGDFVKHIVGPTSMLTLSGEEWKRSRAMFNPGFSSTHLMTLAGGIVDDTLTFCEVLSEHAKRGDIFLLEEAATRLTIDIIGRVVLDVELNAQKSDNELVSAFRHAISWTPKPSDINPFANLNPLRPIMTWWWQRQMNAYLDKMLHERFVSRKGAALRKGRKPAIDLALDEYLAQHDGNAKVTDKAFRRQAIDNMSTFIFAGHDTTSSTICYVYHLLNLHPQCLAKVRQEHDDVFGADVSQAADLIRKTPNLINSLPYTLAIIKEVLRLFPAASTIRDGEKDFYITHNGKSYPTEGFMVWVSNHAISRRADLFPCPDEFHPERFLPSPPPDCPQTFKIPNDAWRPFEKGPRACIGRELALIETKIIMVLTLRSFDVSAAYEEWDRVHGNRRRVQKAFGYRAYQSLAASAKPVDGMPGRVKMREW